MDTFLNIENVKIVQIIRKHSYIVWNASANTYMNKLG